MVNGKCSKGFPKPYSESTTTDGNGYPLYRRRDDGRAYDVGRKLVTNQYIVPYSPYLSEYFNCHINFECPYSFASLKYIFKYIHKGPNSFLVAESLLILFAFQVLTVVHLKFNRRTKLPRMSMVGIYLLLTLPGKYFSFPSITQYQT